MGEALIIVDVQNDFCEGGSLGVQGGAALATAISEYMSSHSYAHIVATRDYHIDPGDHFSANPDFVRTWPVHCVAGTPGASFHPGLNVVPISAVFSKGHYSSAYSGFEGYSGATEGEGPMLADWLRTHEVNTVHIVGIATDHCVRATALDATREGFDTMVLLELTAGVSPSTVDSALDDMRAAGVIVA